MSSPKIVFPSGLQFADRAHAGRMLSKELLVFKTSRPLICAIPRGGLVVAKAAADALGAELDVVLARKLRSPSNEELAFGAVSENGKMILNDKLISHLGIEWKYIRAEEKLQLEEIRRRITLYRGRKKRISAKGRTAIIIDDGLATGATMEAALVSLRAEHPEKLICAVPVASADTVSEISRFADQTICLTILPDFQAVGQAYNDFTQVTDEDVLRILRERKKEMDALT